MPEEFLHFLYYCFMEYTWGSVSTQHTNIFSFLHRTEYLNISISYRNIKALLLFPCRYVFSVDWWTMHLKIDAYKVMHASQILYICLNIHSHVNASSVLHLNAFVLHLRGYIFIYLWICMCGYTLVDMYACVSDGATASSLFLIKEDTKQKSLFSRCR